MAKSEKLKKLDVGETKGVSGGVIYGRALCESIKSLIARKSVVTVFSGCAGLKFAKK